MYNGAGRNASTTRTPNPKPRLGGGLRATHVHASRPEPPRATGVQLMQPSLVQPCYSFFNLKSVVISK